MRSASSLRDWRIEGSEMRMTKPLENERTAAPGRADMKRLRRTTDAEIDRQITADLDTAPDQADEMDWQVVRHPPVPDVRHVRAKLGLSQVEFARRFGL